MGAETFPTPQPITSGMPADGNWGENGLSTSMWGPQGNGKHAHVTSQGDCRKQHIQLECLQLLWVGCACGGHVPQGGMPVTHIAYEVCVREAHVAMGVHVSVCL